MATLSWLVDGNMRQCRLSALTTIGRSRDNDIALDDRRVSKSHARIVHEGDEWIFEDLESRNGSRINDELRTRAVLREGDRIRLGSVHLTFALTVQDASPSGTTARTLSDRDASSGTLGGAETPPAGEFLTLKSLNATTVRMAVPGDGDLRAFSRRLKASYEISQATAATLDLPDILDRTLSALLGIFDTAECAAAMLLDRQTGEIASRTVKRRAAQQREELRVSQTALDHVLQNRKSLLCLDTRSDDRFAEAVSVAALGIRSMMIAPILFRDVQYGAIYIDRRGTAAGFTQEDLELLTVAAVDVGACVANAELHRTAVDHERLAAIGETVASLSHCIRNCLQGIQGGAYVLEDGLERRNLDRTVTGWGMVKHKNSFLEELVRDLLTYSKAREPEYALTDLNGLCADVCNIGPEQGSGGAVTVTFVPDTELESVEFDPKGIRRCLMNLVKNSVDACSDTGGEVIVETVHPGDDGMVTVRVRDNGYGMSEETLGRLFTVFFSTKGSKGTGLGLPLVKKTLAEHGGRIDVDSREGVGTVFEIRFPAKRHSDHAEGGKNGAERQDGAGGG